MTPSKPEESSVSAEPLPCTAAANDALAPACCCSSLACVLYLVMHLFAPSTACAQSLPDETTLFPTPADIGQDVSYVLQTPMRMDRSDYLTALGVAGITVGVVSALDQPTYHLSHGPDGNPPTLVPRHLAGLGRAYDQVGPTRFILGAATTFAASGIATDNPKLTRTSVHIIEAAFLTQMLTGVFKQTVGRSRPYTQSGPFEANAFDFEVGHAARSMPSGHTSKIFAVASVIAHEYDAWWVKAAAYGTATSAGLQRIESGKHWLSDVFVGALLGYFVGRTVSGAPKRIAPEEQSITYRPVVSPNRVGLSIHF